MAQKAVIGHVVALAFRGCELGAHARHMAALTRLAARRVAACLELGVFGMHGKRRPAVADRLVELVARRAELGALEEGTTAGSMEVRLVHVAARSELHLVRAEELEPGHVALRVHA